MGACFSCKASKTNLITLKRIRVVHLDGSLEEYEDPVTVEQVTSNFPKHYLCTPFEILRFGLVPLKLNHQLRPGQFYFMLPNSTLKFNASPGDLASLTRMLTKVAKTGRCSVKSAPASPSPSPLSSPRATNPSQFLERRLGEIGEETMVRSPRWKPILAGIAEG